MALVNYHAALFFPGGGRAKNASITISIEGSNQPPPLYQDSSALVPQTNPIIADASGVINFWAPPETYLAWLSGTAFRLVVDPFGVPTWSDLYVHDQFTPSDVWTIDHYFGVQPEVTVVIGGAVAYGLVTYTSANRVEITFNSPINGKAYLRR